MLIKRRIFHSCCSLMMILLFLGIRTNCAFPGSSSSPPGDPGSFPDHLSLVIPLEDRDRGSVDGTSQRGSYLAAVYGKENILVLDMDMNQVLYNGSTPGEPIYLAPQTFGKYLLYYSSRKSKMTRLDLFSGEKLEMEGDFYQRLTDDVFILTRDGFVLDVAAGTPSFRKNLVPGKKVVSVGHTFIFPRNNSRGNFDGYEAFSRTGEPLFYLEDDTSINIFLPESEIWMRTFPLPIVRWKEKEPFIDMLHEDGSIGRSFDLKKLGMKMVRMFAPNPLEILDHQDGKYLISLRGQRENAKGLKEEIYYYCITDMSGELKVLLKDAPLSFGKFTTDGGTIFLKRGRDSVLRGFDPAGRERFRRPMEEWFSSNSDIHILGESEVLLNSSWNVFLKCSTLNGETTGIYPFPKGFYLESDIHVFEDRVFVFSHSMPEIPCEIRGTNLLSFQAGSGSSGWLDIIMAPLDPNAGSDHETFDDTEVRVKFTHNYGSGFDKDLRVAFAEGRATPAGSSGREFLWTTPSLGSESERVVSVTAFLGPVSRSFPVKILAPKDLLEFSIAKRFEPVNSQGTMKYFVDWELRNNSPYDVVDLEWTLNLENMKCAYPRLPGQIKGNETKTGTIEIDLIFPEMVCDPAWQGYRVKGSGTVTLRYSRGQTISLDFDSLLEIPALYSFKLFLHDPELKKTVKIDNYLYGLRFFDEDGNDITSAISVSSRGTINEVSGFAPGLPGKPVRIMVSFAESEQWTEMAFRDSTSPRISQPWAWSGPSITLTLPPNKAPVADFSILTQDPKWSSTTALDASLSDDPDGNIVLYSWSSRFLPEAVESDSPGFTCQFSRGGVIPVTLTVTDNKGATAAVTKNIHVSNPISVGGEETAAQAVFQREERASYKITVRTGDRNKSGTDAFVYLALFGPADENGTPTGSGEMLLYRGTSTLNPEPFKQGKTDEFLIPEDHGMSSIESVDRMTLRHSNHGDGAGWFVEGVIVKNLKNDREWTFATNRWLATDEPPDHKTYAEFPPLEGVYGRGILFGGDIRSIGLIEASDTIFILPEGAGSFHFTELEGSWDLRVEKDGVLVGTHNQSGRGLRDPLLLEAHDRGISYDASMITAPVRFHVRRGPCGGEVRQDGYVWVFPSNWAGFEKAARMAMMADSLIRDLRRDKPDRNPYDIFRCGKSAMEKFAALQPDLAVQGLIVLQYGISSLTIFGGIEDAELDFFKENASNEYFAEKLPRVIPEILDKTYVSVMGEMGEIFTSMLGAAEWATEFFTSSIFMAPSESYKIDLLKYLAANDTNFTQSAELMLSARTFLQTAITAMEGNSPSACETALSSMSRLVIGECPDSIDPADHAMDYGTGVINRINNPPYQYPLALLLSLEMQNIAAWRENGHIFFNDYFGVTPGLDKKTATRAAMDLYEPAIRDMARIAGILAQIALMGQ